MNLSKLGPPLSPSPGLVERIVERIVGLIRSGELAEGSKLPPERELADLLGVSRTMLREALAALQLTGFLERAPAVGTRVKRGAILNSTAEFEHYIRAGTSIAELLGTRLALDLGIVHLLCDGRPHDFQEAKQLLDLMRDEVARTDDPKGYLVPSVDFHVALARATEHWTLVGAVTHVTDLMRPHLWLLEQHYDLKLAQDSLRLHESIFSAVESGDLISALAHAKAHYISYPALTDVSNKRHRPLGATG